MKSWWRRWFSPRSESVASIAILDDIFPHPLSAFRYEEFSVYLDDIPGAVVASDATAFGAIDETRPFDEVVRDHLATFPAHAGRVRRATNGQLPRAAGYYCIFINNAFRHVQAIEATGRGFAFTLYPGGGFYLDDPESDAKLARVFGSPAFRHVIVTQPRTRDYVLSHGWCTEADMTFVAGNVVPRAALRMDDGRRRFGLDKPRADIAFAAHRYTPRGEDKGYDLFIETACALVRAGFDADFHAVGPWDETIVPLGEAAGRIRFHGLLATEALRGLMRTCDIVLSPNRPDRLGPGAFDGFPTGSCVEAGLQGAAIVCTDELALNTRFVDGQDIVLIRPERDSIERAMASLLRDPSRLAAIGEAGRASLLDQYSHRSQMGPRIAILRRLAGLEPG